MKPTIFKNQEDLRAAVDSLPVYEGQAQVLGQEMNTEEIISRIKVLIPKTYEYKETLKNAAGGLGNNKSVYRFIEAAAGNVSAETLEEYIEMVDRINDEVDEILETGGSQELAERLQEARTNAARFRMIRDTVQGFRDKLQYQMQRIETKYDELGDRLKEQSRKLGTVISSEDVQVITKEVDNTQEKISHLIEVMDEYCALQIAYNGIRAGAQ